MIHLWTLFANAWIELDRLSDGRCRPQPDHGNNGNNAVAVLDPGDHNHSLQHVM